MSGPPGIGEQEILSGHQHATLERIRTQDVVLLGQDTTFLDDGTTRPQKGMGTVKVKVREEHLLHPTVAFTPARLNVGVLGLKMWQRPEPPVAQERHRKPLAAKESARWLEGYQLACVVCEPREWHTIYTMQHHCPPPEAPPSLREMVRGLAQLGGFLARTADGEPGITSIWQGYQRLHEFIYAVETHRTVNAL